MNKDILNKFSLFLFDWDGCLAKTLDNWLITYRSIYKKYKVFKNDKDILEHSWGNLELGPKYFGLKNCKEVWSEIVTEVAKKNSIVPLYRNAFETLKELKSLGKKVTIVTSSELKIVKPAIEFNKLSEYIDGVFTEELVKKPKPNPEIIFLVLKTFKESPEKAIIIGDTSKDIIAGKNAGISTMLVLHEENRQFYDFNKSLTSNPEYLIKGF